MWAGRACFGLRLYGPSASSPSQRMSSTAWRSCYSLPAPSSPPAVRVSRYLDAAGGLSCSAGGLPLVWALWAPCTNPADIMRSFMLPCLQQHPGTCLPPAALSCDI